MRCSFSGRAGTYCLSAPVTVRPTSQLRVSSLCRTRAVNLQQPGYPQRRQSGTSRLAFHSTSSSSANQELSNSEVNALLGFHSTACVSTHLQPPMLWQVPENQQGFRHAILHDFCMSVPYGSIVLAAGLVSLLFGSGRKGIMFALGGAFMLAGAFFSLLQWRQHRPSTMFTLASAGKRQQSMAMLTFGCSQTFWVSTACYIQMHLASHVLQ